MMRRRAKKTCLKSRLSAGDGSEVSLGVRAANLNHLFFFFFYFFPAHPLLTPDSGSGKRKTCT